MSIELSPLELGFRRPFTQEVTQILRLRNPGPDPVAFKVKTTAPKQYCVRPNSGRVEPGQDVEVNVLLQAMKEDPPLEHKCRDKFLVQSVAVTPDRDFPSVASLWQYVEHNVKNSIQEKKIRVAFLPADGVPSTPIHNNINGTHFHDTPSTEPPAYRSLSPEAASPAHVSATGPVSLPESRPSNNKHLGDAVASAFNPTSSTNSNSGTTKHEGSTSASTVMHAVTNAIPTSADDVKGQLEDAKATISKLTQQLQEQVLHQRKTDAVVKDSRERLAGGTTGMGTQMQPAAGVPVQVVLGLCLLSFLLAYLLF